MLPYVHKTCGEGGGQVLPYLHKTETLVVKEVVVKEVVRCYLTVIRESDNCGEEGGQVLPYCHKRETLVVKKVVRCYITVIRERHLW